MASSSSSVSKEELSPESKIKQLVEELYQPSPLEEAYGIYLLEQVLGIEYTTTTDLRINGRILVPFLSKSGVNRLILRNMWTAADPHNIGTLTSPHQFHTLIRLVALAQEPDEPLQKALNIAYRSGTMTPVQAMILCLQQTSHLQNVGPAMFEGVPVPDSMVLKELYYSKKNKTNTNNTNTKNGNSASSVTSPPAPSSLPPQPPLVHASSSVASGSVGGNESVASGTTGTHDYYSTTMNNNYGNVPPSTMTMTMMNAQAPQPQLQPQPQPQPSFGSSSMPQQPEPEPTTTVSSSSFGSMQQQQQQQPASFPAAPAVVIDDDDDPFGSLVQVQQKPLPSLDAFGNQMVETNYDNNSNYNMGAAAATVETNYNTTTSTMMNMMGTATATSSTLGSLGTTSSVPSVADVFQTGETTTTTTTTTTNASVALPPTTNSATFGDFSSSQPPQLYGGTGIDNNYNNTGFGGYSLENHNGQHHQQQQQQQQQQLGIGFSNSNNESQIQSQQPDDEFGDFASVGPNGDNNNNNNYDFQNAFGGGGGVSDDNHNNNNMQTSSTGMVAYNQAPGFGVGEFPSSVPSMTMTTTTTQNDVNVNVNMMGTGFGSVGSEFSTGDNNNNNNNNHHQAAADFGDFSSATVPNSNNNNDPTYSASFGGGDVSNANYNYNYNDGNQVTTGFGGFSDTNQYVNNNNTNQSVGDFGGDFSSSGQSQMPTQQPQQQQPPPPPPQQQQQQQATFGGIGDQPSAESQQMSGNEPTGWDALDALAAVQDAPLPSLEPAKPPEETQTSTIIPETEPAPQQQPNVVVVVEEESDGFGDFEGTTDFSSPTNNNNTESQSDDNNNNNNNNNMFGGFEPTPTTDGPVTVEEPSDGFGDFEGTVDESSPQVNDNFGSFEGPSTFAPEINVPKVDNPSGTNIYDARGTVAQNVPPPLSSTQQQPTVVEQPSSFIDFTGAQGQSLPSETTTSIDALGWDALDALGEVKDAPLPPIQPTTFIDSGFQSEIGVPDGENLSSPVAQVITAGTDDDDFDDFKGVETQSHEAQQNGTATTTSFQYTQATTQPTDATWGAFDALAPINDVPLPTLQPLASPEETKVETLPTDENSGYEPQQGLGNGQLSSMNGPAVVENHDDFDDDFDDFKGVEVQAQENGFGNDASNDASAPSASSTGKVDADWGFSDAIETTGHGALPTHEQSSSAAVSSETEALGGHIVASDGRDLNENADDGAGFEDFQGIETSHQVFPQNEPIPQSTSQEIQEDTLWGAFDTLAPVIDAPLPSLPSPNLFENAPAATSKENESGMSGLVVSSTNQNEGVIDNDDFDDFKGVEMYTKGTEESANTSEQLAEPTSSPQNASSWGAFDSLPIAQDPLLTTPTLHTGEELSEKNHANASMKEQDLTAFDEFAGAESQQTPTVASGEMADPTIDKQKCVDVHSSEVNDDFGEFFGMNNAEASGTNIQEKSGGPPLSQPQNMEHVDSAYYSAEFKSMSSCSDDMSGFEDAVEALGGEANDENKAQPQQAMPSEDEFDEFGDFTDFQGPGTVDPQTYSEKEKDFSIATVPSLSDGHELVSQDRAPADFDAFDSSPGSLDKSATEKDQAEQPKVAPQNANQQIADEEDFGDFSDFQAVVPENHVNPQQSTDEFGDFAAATGDDDFGDFEAVEGPKTDADDFGDFASFQAFEGPAQGNNGDALAELTMFKNEVLTQAIKLPDAIRRVHGTLHDYIDFNVCFEGNIGMEIPLDDERRRRIQRCKQLINLLSTTHTKLALTYWERTFAVIRDELTKGLLLLKEASGFTQVEQNYLNAKMQKYKDCLAEFVRVARLIAASVGDLLLLETSAFITIDTFASSWCSIALMNEVLEVEKTWKEIESICPFLNLKPCKLPSLVDIRSRLKSQDLANTLCSFTLQPLPSPSDPSSTTSVIQWKDKQFLACTANLLANKCTFYLVKG